MLLVDGRELVEVDVDQVLLVDGRELVDGGRVDGGRELLQIWSTGASCLRLTTGPSGSTGAHVVDGCELLHVVDGRELVDGARSTPPREHTREAHGGCWREALLAEFNVRLQSLDVRPQKVDACPQELLARAVELDKGVNQRQSVQVLQSHGP